MLDSRIGIHFTALRLLCPVLLVAAALVPRIISFQPLSAGCVQPPQENQESSLCVLLQTQCISCGLGTPGLLVF